MNTRDEINLRLSNYLSNNLTEKLQAPLIKKIKLFPRSGLTLRVGSDESQLNNWWRHPVKILVTPNKKGFTVVQFRAQFQRWPDNIQAYASGNQPMVDETAEKIQKLTTEYFSMYKDVKVNTKLDKRYSLSLVWQVKFDEQIVDKSNRNFANITKYLAELTQITIALSMSLPVGENEKNITEKEDDNPNAENGNTREVKYKIASRQDIDKASKIIIDIVGEVIEEYEEEIRNGDFAITLTTDTNDFFEIDLDGFETYDSRSVDYMVHYLLRQENLYELFLSEEHMKDMEEFYSENPEDIYSPPAPEDDDDYSLFNESRDCYEYVIYNTKKFIADKLINELGQDHLRDEMEDYLE